MNMKISKMQIIRRISQVLAFIFFAGIFSLAFSGFEKIYTLILDNNFSLTKIQMFIAPIAIVVILTILFGRFFCGWLCAFGALNDLMFLISKRLFKIKFHVSKSLDSKLKYLKYAILVLIVVFVWSLNLIPADKFSPWIAFAQLGDTFNGGFSFSIGALILLLILIGAMFIERFFCRYLCPLGAILAILSKIKITKIKKPTSKCSKCKLCSFSCPMDIDLNSMDTVNSGECISCLKCVNVCPKQNARVNIFTRSFNSVVYVISALIVFMVTNFSDSFLTQNNTTSVNTKTNTTQQTSTSSTKNKIYKDGVYEGTADGFHPGVNVSVTVKNDKIVDVQVLSTNDDQGFKEQPIELIPQEIIKAQSTDVDVVSGATFTSRGIMNAVKAALSKAKI